MTKKYGKKIDTYEATRELDRRALALILQGVDLATAYRRAMEEMRAKTSMH